MDEYGYEPTETHIRDWEEWKAKIPPEAAKLCERFLPWVVYRLKADGRRVGLMGFNGEGPEVRVIVATVPGAREVFHVLPDEIEAVQRLLH